MSLLNEADVPLSQSSDGVANVVISQSESQDGHSVACVSPGETSACANEPEEDSEAHSVPSGASDGAVNISSSTNSAVAVVSESHSTGSPQRVPVQSSIPEVASDKPDVAMSLSGESVANVVISHSDTQEGQLASCVSVGEISGCAKGAGGDTEARESVGSTDNHDESVVTRDASVGDVTEFTDLDPSEFSESDDSYDEVLPSLFPRMGLSGVKERLREMSKIDTNVYDGASLLGSTLAFETDEFLTETAAHSPSTKSTSDVCTFNQPAIEISEHSNPTRRAEPAFQSSTPPGDKVDDRLYSLKSETPIDRMSTRSVSINPENSQINDSTAIRSQCSPIIEPSSRYSQISESLSGRVSLELASSDHIMDTDDTNKSSSSNLWKFDSKPSKPPEAVSHSATYPKATNGSQSSIVPSSNNYHSIPTQSLFSKLSEMMSKQPVKSTVSRKQRSQRSRSPEFAIPKRLPTNENPIQQSTNSSEYSRRLQRLALCFTPRKPVRSRFDVPGLPAHVAFRIPRHTPRKRPPVRLVRTECAKKPRRSEADIALQAVMERIRRRRRSASSGRSERRRRRDESETARFIAKWEKKLKKRRRSESFSELPGPSRSDVTRPTESQQKSVSSSSSESSIRTHQSSSCGTSVGRGLSDSVSTRPSTTFDTTNVQASPPQPTSSTSPVIPPTPPSTPCDPNMNPPQSGLAKALSERFRNLKQRVSPDRMIIEDMNSEHIPLSQIIIQAGNVPSPVACTDSPVSSNVPEFIGRLKKRQRVSTSLFQPANFRDSVRHRKSSETSARCGARSKVRRGRPLSKKRSRSLGKRQSSIPPATRQKSDSFSGCSTGRRSFKLSRVSDGQIVVSPVSTANCSGDILAMSVATPMSDSAINKLIKKSVSKSVSKPIPTNTSVIDKTAAGSSLPLRKSSDKPDSVRKLSTKSVSSKTSSSMKKPPSKSDSMKKKSRKKSVSKSVSKPIPTQSGVIDKPDSVRKVSTNSGSSKISTSVKKPPSKQKLSKKASSKKKLSKKASSKSVSKPISTQSDVIDKTSSVSSLPLRKSSDKPGSVRKVSTKPVSSKAPSSVKKPPSKSDSTRKKSRKKSVSKSVSKLIPANPDVIDKTSSGSSLPLTKSSDNPDSVRKVSTKPVSSKAPSSVKKPPSKSDSTRKKSRKKSVSKSVSKLIPAKPDVIDKTSSGSSLPLTKSSDNPDSVRKVSPKSISSKSQSSVKKPPSKSASSKKKLSKKSVSKSVSKHIPTKPDVIDKTSVGSAESLTNSLAKPDSVRKVSTKSVSSKSQSSVKKPPSKSAPTKKKLGKKSVSKSVSKHIPTKPDVIDKTAVVSAVSLGRSSDKPDSVRKVSPKSVSSKASPSIKKPPSKSDSTRKKPRKKSVSKPSVIRRSSCKTPSSNKSSEKSVSVKKSSKCKSSVRKTSAKRKSCEENSSAKSNPSLKTSLGRPSKKRKKSTPRRIISGKRAPKVVGPKRNSTKSLQNSAENRPKSDKLPEKSPSSATPKLPQKQSKSDVVKPRRSGRTSKQQQSKITDAEKPA
eukprot:35087_1